MSTSLIPSGEQIAAMEAICAKAVESGLLPVAYKNNPAGAFLAMQMGNELGIQPLMSVRNIGVIQGKPEFSAALIAGLMIKAGVSWKIIQRDGSAARCEFHREGWKEPSTIDFTFDDASKAGLTGGNNYKKYLPDMLWARMMSRAGKIMAPDVLAGVYTTGEISGAIELRGPSTPLEEPAPTGLSRPEPPATLKEVEVLKDEPEPPAAPKKGVDPNPTKITTLKAEVGLPPGITDPQLKLVQMSFKEASVDTKARKDFLKRKYKVSSAKYLSKHQATKIIDGMSKPNAGSRLYQWLEEQEAIEKEAKYKEQGDELMEQAKANHEKAKEGIPNDEIPF